MTIGADEPHIAAAIEPNISGMEYARAVRTRQAVDEIHSMLAAVGKAVLALGYGVGALFVHVVSPDHEMRGRPRRRARPTQASLRSLEWQLRLRRAIKR